ncbi:Putative MetA-pathway of phenol degradation [Riemerella columbipharyngis]|uniref:Putative MetA-pathway of phenol degradation n=2 Tax=Riemerella columbipharyngis TaxID=1071918 RepID=A0A1G7C2R9_9FLAO|nr:Putative MetA-pathway of phenol degradation [Riemerella columbipharyngis]
MLRYALNRTVELRILIDAEKQENSRGLKPIAFSFKQKIIDKNKIVPAITLVGYASMGSLSSKDFRTNNVNTEWKLAFENTLSNMITLGYNIGTSENFKNFNLSVSNGYALSGKLSAFVEYFSTINKKEHNIDIGVLYLLNPNLQLDLAVGSPVFTHSNDFFGTLGVSYKFKKNKYIGGIPKSLKQSRNFN